MAFLGDIFSFESNKLGNMWDKYKKDPERLFLGINTPLESKLWGTVLGKDYTPTVDMFGGATPDDVSTARAKGINTGPGESMHGIARTIVGAYAGGAASNGLGNAFGSGSQSAGGSGLLSSGASAEGMGGGTGLLPGASGQGFQAGSMGNSLGTQYASASPGFMGTAGQYMTQFGKAAQTASAVKGLLSQPQQQIQASPVMQSGGGANALTQLAAQNQQQTDDALAQAAQARAMRRQMFRGGLL